MIGPLQFSQRHWSLRNLTLHSGILPYKSLKIFSACTVLSHGSIMLPPHQPSSAIIFKILLLVYKSLNGTPFRYLAQKHYHSHTRSLRFVRKKLLRQPKLYTKTYVDRAFAVHATREWNVLPYEILKSYTISSFKRTLKPYLFTKFSKYNI